MDNDNNNGGGGQVGAALTLLTLGAAIGAAAVLLLSSPPGQDVKAQVSGAAGEWQDKARDWRTRVSDALAQARERVVEAIEAAQGDDHRAA